MRVGGRPLMWVTGRRGGPQVRLAAAEKAGQLPENDMCGVRGRMILTDLLKMPGTEEKLADVAAELGVRL
jgi:hypothetical protein